MNGVKRRLGPAVTLLVIVGTAHPRVRAGEPNVVSAPSAEQPDQARALFERSSSWHRSQKVYALAQTPDGFVWAGTDSGLIRYDGRAFQTYSSSNSTGLRRNVVRALAVDEHGGLWLGLDDGGGVARLHDQHITPVDTGAALRARAVTAIATVNGGAELWVGTDAGLCQHTFRSATHCEFQTEIGEQQVFSIVVSSDGSVFVGAEKGFYERIGGRFQLVDGLAMVQAMHRDHAGTLWLSDAQKGLFRRDPGQPPKLVVPIDPGPKGQMAFTALASDDRGDLWVGWTWGHGRLVGGDLNPRRSTGLHSVALLTDREGGLWVGTRWGVVSRYGAGRVVTHPTNAPGELPVAFSVAQSTDGAVWVTHVRSLVRMRGAETFRFESGKSLPSWCPRSIAPAKDGGVWMGTCDAGLIRVRDDRAVRLHDEALPIPKNIQSVFEDRHGTLWLGAEAGDLYQLKKGELTQVPFANARCIPGEARRSFADECAFSVTSMVDSRRGGIWAAVRRNGLRRVAPEGVEVFTREDGLPTNDLVALYEDREGVLWIGTQAHGLVRMKDRTFQRADASVGLPAQSIHGIVEDPDGELWMSSERGIFRIDKRQLNDLFEGRTQRLEGHAYGIEDGMESLVTVQSFPPSILLAADRRLMVPTDRGLTIVATDQVHVTAGFASPMIEELRVDGVAHDPTRAVHKELDWGERGMASLELRVVLPNFTVPHRVGVQHRLVGHETAWRSTNERIIRYANLPAGTYSLELRGDMDGQTWRAAVKSPPIVVRAFAQRSIFRVMLGLAGLMLTGLGLTIWLWLQRRRFNLVLQERNRIARDLHDSMAQYFTALAYQMERVTQLIPDKPAEALRVGEQTKEVLRQARLEARESIHNLRAEQLTRRSLGQTLRSVVEQTQLSGRAKLSYEQTGTDRVIDEDLQRQIVRIVQEATVNALAHANAENVIVMASFEDGEVCIHVVDDGVGFKDPDGPRVGHHGLSGMRERAAAIGGHLEIRTSDGEGTMVELRVAV